MKRFAFVTDIHLDEPYPRGAQGDPKENWRLILEDIESKRIDQIIFGGDIGTKESNRWFFDSIRKFEVEVILGNHDSFSEVRKYYNKDIISATDELYYSHEDEYLKYIFLDSSSAALSQSQLLWLADEVQTHKKVLLLIHHPVLEVDSPVDRMYPLQNRKAVKDILNESKRDIVIMCGHCHTSDERVEAEIRQIITLAGSYQIRQHTKTVEVITDTFGYRIIQIDDDEIETELVLNKSGRFV